MKFYLVALTLLCLTFVGSGEESRGASKYRTRGDGVARFIPEQPLRDQLLYIYNTLNLGLATWDLEPDDIGPILAAAVVWGYRVATVQLSDIVPLLITFLGSISISSVLGYFYRVVTNTLEGGTTFSTQTFLS